MMGMNLLEGKVALVTGAGRNIGWAPIWSLAGVCSKVVSNAQSNARSNVDEAEAVAALEKDQ